MKESISRWVDNGLPRKGWSIYDVEDAEEIAGACEWCLTPIRFQYVLEHPDCGNDHHIAGCVCTEHLCQDYATPRRLKKEHDAEKRRQAKLHGSLDKLSDRRNWRENANRNLCAIYDKNLTTIFYRNGKFSWVRDGHFSGKFLCEKAALEDFIDSMRKRLK